jgi:hypothetical protein
MAVALRCIPARLLPARGDGDVPGPLDQRTLAGDRGEWRPRPPWPGRRRADGPAAPAAPTGCAPRVRPRRPLPRQAEAADHLLGNDGLDRRRQALLVVFDADRPRQQRIRRAAFGMTSQQPVNVARDTANRCARRGRAAASGSPPAVRSRNCSGVTRYVFTVEDLHLLLPVGLPTRYDIRSESKRCQVLERKRTNGSGAPSTILLTDVKVHRILWPRHLLTQAV